MKTFDKITFSSFMNEETAAEQFVKMQQMRSPREKYKTTSRKIRLGNNKAKTPIPLEKETQQQIRQLTTRLDRNQTIQLIKTIGSIIGKQNETSSNTTRKPTF